MNKFVLVVLGITSNLAKIKLIPAIFDLYQKGDLAETCKILGVSHNQRSRGEMEELIKEAVISKVNKRIDDKVLKDFFDKFEFISGDLEDTNFYIELKSTIEKESGAIGCKNVIFYLATHPVYYKSIFENLHRQELSKSNGKNIKLMIEKPIGNDYTSAKELNELLNKYFDEKQIYRIDHYLGKETVQNILTFRFNNDIFERLTESDLIDHIQITAAEDFGVEARNAYYDNVGALKDVGQNHVLQMLVFATMGRPFNWSASEVTKRRLEVLSSLKPMPESLVLGQYEKYSEDNIETNTFFAFKTELTWGRLRRVPIYVRAGKKLKRSVAEISVVFKNSSQALNALIYRIQPNEGIILRMAAKKPGEGMKIEDAAMQFCYKDVSGKVASPYEKLLMDAIRGEQTFFNDAQEVETQWKFIDSLEAEKRAPLIYKEGTWGPKEADLLIERDGRIWLEPEEVYCKF